MSYALIAVLFASLPTYLGYLVSTSYPSPNCMHGPAPHRLIIEERDGYLFVLYGGNPLTLEMILETITRVATLIRERGYQNVLLVRDAPLLESDENRAFIANLIKSSTSGDVRFAIVDEYGNDPEEVKKAVEGSRRAGWDLTGFETIEDAERWLTS